MDVDEYEYEKNSNNDDDAYEEDGRVRGWKRRFLPVRN